MAEDVALSVAAIFRDERGLLLALLTRRFGDLYLAEEVTSEAIEAALVRWPVDGIPPKPGAWLLTTTRRRAVDRLRRDKAYAARLALLQVEADRPTPEAGPPDDRGGPCARPSRAHRWLTWPVRRAGRDRRIALRLRSHRLAADRGAV